MPSFCFRLRHVRRRRGPRRAGLSTDIRLWIVLDEFNHDILGQSWYLEPDSALGSLSRAFLLPVMKQFVAMLGEKRQVNRL
jgi:hypothetical protein